MRRLWPAIVAAAGLAACAAEPAPAWMPGSGSGWMEAQARTRGTPRITLRTVTTPEAAYFEGLDPSGHATWQGWIHGDTLFLLDHGRRTYWRGTDPGLAPLFRAVHGAARPEDLQTAMRRVPHLSAARVKMRHGHIHIRLPKGPLRGLRLEIVAAGPGGLVPDQPVAPDPYVAASEPPWEVHR